MAKKPIPSCLPDINDEAQIGVKCKLGPIGSFGAYIGQDSEVSFELKVGFGDDADRYKGGNEIGLAEAIETDEHLWRVQTETTELTFSESKGASAEILSAAREIHARNEIDQSVTLSGMRLPEGWVHREAAAGQNLDDVLNQRVVSRGVILDEVAAMLGGQAGHARGDFWSGQLADGTHFVKVDMYRANRDDGLANGPEVRASFYEDGTGTYVDLPPAVLPDESLTNDYFLKGRFLTRPAAEFEFEVPEDDQAQEGGHIPGSGGAPAQASGYSADEVGFPIGHGAHPAGHAHTSAGMGTAIPNDGLTRPQGNRGAEPVGASDSQVGNLTPGHGSHPAGGAQTSAAAQRQHGAILGAEGDGAEAEFKAFEMRTSAPGSAATVPKAGDDSMTRTETLGALNGARQLAWGVRGGDELAIAGGASRMLAHLDGGSDTGFDTTAKALGTAGTVVALDAALEADNEWAVAGLGIDLASDVAGFVGVDTGNLVGEWGFGDIGGVVGGLASLANLDEAFEAGNYGAVLQGVTVAADWAAQALSSTVLDAAASKLSEFVPYAGMFASLTQGDPMGFVISAVTMVNPAVGACLAIANAVFGGLFADDPPPPPEAHATVAVNADGGFYVAGASDAHGGNGGAMAVAAQQAADVMGSLVAATGGRLLAPEAIEPLRLGYEGEDIYAAGREVDSVGEAVGVLVAEMLGAAPIEGGDVYVKRALYHELEGGGALDMEALGEALTTARRYSALQAQAARIDTLAGDLDVAVELEAHADGALEAGELGEGAAAVLAAHQIRATARTLDLDQAHRFDHVSRLNQAFEAEGIDLDGVGVDELVLALDHGRLIVGIGDPARPEASIRSLPHASIDNYAAGADAAMLYLSDGGSWNLASLLAHADIDTGEVVRPSEALAATYDATPDAFEMGAEAADYLAGSAAGDVLAGLGGADTLVTGSGDDRLIGGAGADELRGGAGLDIADYMGSAGAVAVDLANAAARGGDAWGDSFESIEGLTGSARGDLLGGDEGANTLTGLGGADTLFGRAGDDRLDGGIGNDGIDAGTGADTVAGGRGADLMAGRAGTDRLAGGRGADRLGAGAGNDRALGGAGDDFLDGGDGRDALTGGRGDDMLVGGEGTDLLAGGSGRDTAAYTGPAGAYRLRFDDSGTLHVAHGDGPSTGDRLTGIERLRFGDRAMSVDALRELSETLEEREDDRRSYRVGGRPGGAVLWGEAAAVGLVAALATEGAPAALRAVASGDEVVPPNGERPIESADGIASHGDAEALLSGWTAPSAAAPTTSADLAQPARDGEIGTQATQSGAAADRVRFAPALPIGPLIVLGGNESVPPRWAWSAMVTTNPEAPAAAPAADVEPPSSSSHSAQDLIAHRALPTVTGTDGADMLVDRDDLGRVFGLAGGDELQGLAGDDYLNGGPGGDRLVGGAGADMLAGGAGFDVAVYRYAPAGVQVDLRQGISGAAAGDSLADIEGIEGSRHDDELRGRDDIAAHLWGLAGADRLVGGALTDRLDGGADDDALIAGAGADTLIGADGADRLWGQSGDDRLRGNTGHDRIFGGDGADRLLGAGGDDYLTGGAGDDRLDGHTGADILLGGAGIDALSGAEGDDRLFGQTGNDQLDGGSGNDDLSGEADDDVLAGGSGEDRLAGGSGRDRLHAGAGADLLYGGSGADALGSGVGADRLYGGDGDDSLAAGDGDDRLFGDDGADRLDGGAGGDALAGGTGADWLAAGSGDDDLIGGAGADQLTGGAGADTFAGGLGDDRIHVDTADDPAFISGGAGLDTMEYGGTADWTADLRPLEGVERVIGGGGDDRLTAGYGDLQHIAGRAGDDVVVLAGEALFDSHISIDTTASSAELQRGADGARLTVAAETLRFDDATVYLDGRNNDPFAHADALAAREDSALVFDERSLLANDVDLDAGDRLRVTQVAGIDVALSRALDDSYWSSGAAPAGAGTVFGSSGDDGLTGDAGDDALNGGAGRDTLQGGGGDDVLIGGGGRRDVAVFQGARDEYDVTAAGDHLLVEHRDGGADGTDRLHGIQRLRFADGSLLIGEADVRHGEVRVADSGARFLAEHNYHGATSFTYTVGDGRGGSRPEQVSVDVAAVNDAPWISDIVDYSGEVWVESESFRYQRTDGSVHYPSYRYTQASGSGGILGADSEDTDGGLDGGGSLRYELAAQPRWGDVSLSADGTFHYRLNMDEDEPELKLNEEPYSRPRVKVIAPEADPIDVDQAKHISFQVRVTDSEGASAVETVTITNHEPPDGGKKPLALDLDGDGLEFSDIDDGGIEADINGDGALDRMAWIGADDGLLALDRNEDGRVSDFDEISFVDDHPDARTDLEGLALAFDSNGDGVLDTRDERWLDFGVWRDADGDSVQDAGEHRSLAEAGIRRVGLTSDGEMERVADVTLFGRSWFERADGGRGALGDVAFHYRYGSSQPPNLPDSSAASGSMPESGAPPPPATSADALAAALVQLGVQVMAAGSAPAPLAESAVPLEVALGGQADEAVLQAMLTEAG